MERIKALTSDKYIVVEITEEKKSTIESVVGAFISANLTKDNERSELKVIVNSIHECVDYVMNNLPLGVERVDGRSIKSILEAEVNKKQKALPKVIEPEMK